MVSAKFSRRAAIGSKAMDELYAEWRSKTDEALQELTGGPAFVRATVGSKETRKVIFRDSGLTKDYFVTTEHSVTVSLQCPQTVEGIEGARGIASELALQDHTHWKKSVRNEVLNYLREEGFEE